MLYKIGRIILITIICGLTIFYLWERNFFCDFEPTTFNNILTPIATIIAALIYFFSLKELARTNKINKNSDYYNILNYRIGELENAIKERKFFRPSIQNEQLAGKFNKSNPLEFQEIYFELYHELANFLRGREEIKFYDVLNVKKNPPEIRLQLEFFIELKLKIVSELSPVYELLEKIDSSDFDQFQRNALVTQVKEKLLKDYLGLFVLYDFYPKKEVSFLGQKFEIGYNEIPIKDPNDNEKIIGSFSLKGFNRIFNFLKKGNYIED